MRIFLKRFKKPNVVKIKGVKMSRTVSPKTKQGPGALIKKRISIFLQDIRDIFRRPQRGQHYKQSWKNPRRGFGGRYWFPLVLAAIFCAVWGGGHWVARTFESSGLFRIENSSCVGCKVISNQELLDQAGVIMHHTSLLGIQTQWVEKTLKENIPWLARVRVEKDYPSTLHFIVQENQPVAILHNPSGTGSDFFYLNREGEAVFSVPPGGNIDLPVLTGIDMIADAEIRTKATQEAISFLLRVKKNDPVLPLRLISELHANRDGELVCFLVDYPFPIYLGKDKIEKKYQRLTAILADLYRSSKKDDGKGISKTSYILMKYAGEKVYIGMDA